MIPYWGGHAHQHVNTTLTEHTNCGYPFLYKVLMIAVIVFFFALTTNALMPSFRHVAKSKIMSSPTVNFPTRLTAKPDLFSGESLI